MNDWTGEGQSVSTSYEQDERLSQSRKHLFTGSLNHQTQQGHCVQGQKMNAYVALLTSIRHVSL